MNRQLENKREEKRGAELECLNFSPKFKSSSPDPVGFSTAAQGTYKRFFNAFFVPTPL